MISNPFFREKRQRDGKLGQLQKGNCVTSSKQGSNNEGSKFINPSLLFVLGGQFERFKVLFSPAYVPDTCKSSPDI